MKHAHATKIKQRDERGTVEYWRQRALAAEEQARQLLRETEQLQRRLLDFV